MFDDISELTLQKICSDLNKKTRQNSYVGIFKNIENSIDFITDGELQKLVGISYYVDPRLSLEIYPLPVIENKTFIGLNLNVSLRVRMKDFTTGKSQNVQNYEYFSLSKYCFNGVEEKNWIESIHQLNKDVEDTKARLQRLYTPSKKLAVIVGQDPIPKYQILDLLSEYILNYNLRYQNGDIKIDGHLKALYPKGAVCVCENVIFDTLREHSLVSEAQVYLSYLQGGILYAGKQKTWKTRNLKLNNKNSIARYLHWPMT